MQLPPKHVQLPARQGAHVHAHGFPLPEPEAVVLANQDNFSMIVHGVSPSDLSEPLIASTPRAKQADKCQAGRSPSVVAAGVMLSA